MFIFNITLFPRRIDISQIIFQTLNVQIFQFFKNKSKAQVIKLLNN